MVLYAETWPQPRRWPWPNMAKHVVTGAGSRPWLFALFFAAAQSVSANDKEALDVVVRFWLAAVENLRKAAFSGVVAKTQA